jgi:sec-independent protein translocase protein TatA
MDDDPNGARAMPAIGTTEIIVILIIVLIIFGPKRLPDLGRSLGRGMREFKDSVTGKDNDERPELDAATADDDERADDREPVASKSETP